MGKYKLLALFSYEEHVLYTIKGRRDTMIICSLCQDVCVVNNYTLKFDCVYFQNLLFFIIRSINKKEYINSDMYQRLVKSFCHLLIHQAPVKIYNYILKIEFI